MLFLQTRSKFLAGLGGLTVLPSNYPSANGNELLTSSSGTPARAVGHDLDNVTNE
ncbi:MAG TPA: hypothetical protein VF740_04440 [Candidatus Acidoferrum sp.]